MKRCSSLIALALAAACPALAWAESPSVTRVSPHGGQRGTEVDLSLSGAQLKDAQELLLYQPGLEVLKLDAADDKTVKIRLKIAADAALGEHTMRLRTATGISDLRTFWVGPYPVIDEKEPNNDFKAPQKIAMNVTVAGVITNEDVDYFSVELHKGQRLSVELEGIRLGTSLFDAYIAVLDTKRFELASADDTVLLMQDPFLTLLAPEDGTYIIQVRETSYGGGENGAYRLHVGSFPRPLSVFPAGGRPGEEVEVTFLGDIAGPLKRKIRLPQTPSEKYGVYVEDNGQSPPSPNWMRVNDLPNILEVEPNDTREQATVTTLPLPVAFNGVIDKDGDEDWFRFTAKKGDAYEIRAHARAVRSPLDPVLSLYDGKGKEIATNDDQGGLDAAIRFTCSADGEYSLKIRDHLHKGGPAFVYRIEFNAVKPSLYAHIPAYDREPRDQVRQWIVVPKGNRFASWIRVNRQGFGGPVVLDIPGLPEGITMTADPVTPEVDRVVAVFEAAADAKVAGKLCEVRARSTDPKQPIEGGFRQDVNLVYGAPNNTVYYGTRCDRLAVAVAEEAPYSLKIIEPKVPLVQGGSMNLKVVAERKPGFDKPIELRLLWTPPGMGAQGTVTLAQGQTEALYPINANGNAATKTWKIAMIGSAPGANGIVWVSTQLMPLAVASPYVAMKIEMASAEQGKETDVLCKLEHLKPFEGKATVGLYGLPPNVVAEPAEKTITKDDLEVHFHVKVAANSPAGQHKSLFGQIVVSENGEGIAHSVGAGGVLRIDPPPTPKKEASAAKAADAKPGEPAKKLSRLEQLRQDADDKAKEGTK
ncbi:MAG TPA: pre-peptidase C-terminal domain-containing protein [Planctomycetota bacterium]|nr:pre-peptidase C-terminal domain-containing protein [Planctomycetota bacterium]